MSKSFSPKDAIKIGDYDVLGFDMDFTLARYKLVPFSDMIYECITKFLVQNKNYDSSIFHGMHDHTQPIVYSGLIADCERGNLLKLNENGSVLRASHGTRKMSEKELKEAYGENKKFPFFDEFINGIRNVDKKWRFFETFFDIPGLIAYAQIIDHLEAKAEKLPGDIYLKTFGDVYDGFEDMYVPSQFAGGCGFYFPKMKAHANRYIDCISEKVKEWLRKLHGNGRKTFLMTSSYPDYTNHLMEIILGKDWKTYFDLTIYGARKPKFFTETKPFIRIENCVAMEEVRNLEVNKEYCHGNFTDLTAFLKRITGKDDPKVIYLGDNLFADAWPSTLLARWDSILILEDMDAEGYAVSDGTVPGHEDELEDPDVAPAKRKRRYEHSSLITEEEIELLLSSFWGSPFIDKDESSMSNNGTGNDNMKTMNTCYGSLIAQYATICVPSVEYLSGVPIDHEFGTFSTEPGNTRGFHPGRPRSLLPS